jgi:hypothetical protein
LLDLQGGATHAQAVGWHYLCSIAELVDVHIFFGHKDISSFV